MERKILFEERRIFANELIELFKDIKFDVSKGVSISINGEWGTGKTFFKDKFKEMLLDENFIVFEYNAWENDYNEDPFPSLVGNIVSQMENLDNLSGLEKITNNIKTNGLKMLKELMPILVVSLVKHFGLGEAYGLLEEVKDGSEIVTKHLTDLMFDYNKKEKTINDFKISLSQFRVNYTQYKQSLNISYPVKQPRIIILVDELDRCKPDYALKILERIKHFFNIENYIFIFLNNKNELKNSIECVYGISNGNKYLEKFFDYQLEMPEISKVKHIRSLYLDIIEEYHEDLFKNKMIFQFCDYLNNYKEYFSLRHMEKMIKYYNLIIKVCDIESYFEMLSLPLYFIKKYSNDNIIDDVCKLIEGTKSIFENFPLRVELQRGKIIFTSIFPFEMLENSFKIEYENQIEGFKYLEISNVKMNNDNAIFYEFDANNVPQINAIIYGKSLHVDYLITSDSNKSFKEFLGRGAYQDFGENKKVVNNFKKIEKKIELLLNMVSYKENED